MPENNITIKFKPSGDQKLLTALKNLADAQDKLNGKMQSNVAVSKKVSKQTGILDAQGKRLAKTNGFLANSFATIRSKMLLWNFAMAMGVRQLFELVKEAGKVEALRHGFEKLSQAGNFATDTLKQLRIATNGTMSDMDLLTQANNAMVLGVAAGTEEMAKMFDGAQRLGRALGRDTKTSIESLVTGIGRQSRLMLDNIGIIVKADQAYKEYADSVGISVDQLSNLDKKAAFSAAALKSLQEEVDKLGKEALTNQDKIDKMGVSLQNLGVAIGTYIAPQVGMIADWWANWINGANEAQDTMPKTNKTIDELSGRMRTQIIIWEEAEKAQKELIDSGKFGLPITTKQTEEYKILQKAVDGATQKHEELNVERAKEIRLLDEENKKRATNLPQIQAETKYNDDLVKAKGRLAASSQTLFEGTAREIALNKIQVKLTGEQSKIDAQTRSLKFQLIDANEQEKVVIESIIAINEKARIQIENNSESEQAAINRKHDLIDALKLEETQKLMIAAMADGELIFNEEKAISEQKILELQAALNLEGANTLSINKQIFAEKKKLMSLEAQEAQQKLKNYSKIAGGLAGLNDAMKGSMKVTVRLQQIQAMVDAYAGAQSGWAMNKKAYPFPIPELLYAADIATGLAQARALSTSIGDKFEQGGLVGGRRHSQGGTMIEAEQGEFVMSRNAVNAVGVEAMNRINAGGGAGSVNISFAGNVMSQDFIEDEAIPMIKEAIRRGADIGVS